MLFPAEESPKRKMKRLRTRVERLTNVPYSQLMQMSNDAFREVMQRLSYRDVQELERLSGTVKAKIIQARVWQAIFTRDYPAEAKRVASDKERYLRLVNAKSVRTRDLMGARDYLQPQGQRAYVNDPEGRERTYTFYKRLYETMIRFGSLDALENRFIRERQLYRSNEPLLGMVVLQDRLNGDMVVSLSTAQTFRFQSLNTGAWEEFRVPDEVEHLFGLVASPDGTMVATTAQERVSRNLGILICQVATKELALLQYNDLPVSSTLQFSPDSKRIMLVSGYGPVRIFDIESGEVVNRVGRVPNVVATTAAYDPTGERVVIAYVDGSLYLHRLDGVGPPQNIPTAGGVQRQIGTIAFSPNGRWMATSANDGTIILYAVQREYIVVGQLLGQQGEIRNLIFSPDSAQLLAVSDGVDYAHVYDMDRFRAIGLLQTRNRLSFRAAAFSSDGQRIVTAGTSTVDVWTRGPILVSQQMSVQ